MFTMKKQGLSSAIVVLCGVLVLAASATAVTVDLFEEGQLLSQHQDAGDPSILKVGKVWDSSINANIYPDLDWSLETGLVDVLGGSRYVQLDLIEPSPSTDADNYSNAQIVISGGYLDFSNPSGFKTKLSLVYDNNGNGLGNIDFTDGGDSDAVLIKLLSSDLGGEFTVIATDVNGTTSQLKQAPVVNPGDPPVIMAFRFVDFDVPTFDWTAVKAIEYQFDALTSGDYQIDLLGTGTIPEPMTMSAVFASLAGLGGYLRRRRS